LRNQSERLDVVERCRLLPESLLGSVGRTQARFRTVAFDGFQQRRAFPTNIPARTDEHLNVECQTRPENALPKQSRLTASLDLRFDDLPLPPVLMANIEESICCADH